MKFGLVVGSSGIMTFGAKLKSCWPERKARASIAENSYGKARRMQAKCREHREQMAEIISVVARKPCPTGVFNGNPQSSKWALAAAAAAAGCIRRHKQDAAARRRHSSLLPIASEEL